MYSGYQIDFTDFDAKYFEIGKKLFEKDISVVKRNLDSYALTPDALNGVAIQSSWFPQIKADVFISHSHDDEEAAITLAGFLFDTFHIKTFIDSCVWNYSVDLLQEVDKRFCYIEDSDTYSYQQRNLTTSHIHMMLATSLMMMIDQTECLIFMNTPNSLNTNDIVNATNSPWIYSEIVMSRCMQRKPKEHHRSEMKKATREAYENFNIAYPISTLHLKELNEMNVREWVRRYRIDSSQHALDVLYEIVPMEDEYERIY